jgi:3-phenylpropionate/trans-cinnamate dioxygenase ferredoxin subunit
MQPGKTYKWHKIAESIPEIENIMGNPCLVKVEGKELCISIYQQQVRACSARCPHAGGKMHQGWVDPLGQIVCPLHRYRFNPSTGLNSSGEGYHLKTYPVELREDGVYVGIETDKWWGFTTF